MDNSNLIQQNSNDDFKKGGDSDGLQEVNSGIVRERKKATEMQEDVASKLEEVDRKSKSFFGNLMMREGDQKMLKKLDEERSKALDTMLSNRNESLRVMSETMTRYTKTLANTLVMTLETSNRSAVDQHYLEIKHQLLQNLNEMDKRFKRLAKEKLEEMEDCPGPMKDMVEKQYYIMINDWLDDYKKIIEEFSEIRDNRFK